MSKTKARVFNIFDYQSKNFKFDTFGDYTDEQWLLVQMQIDANQKERERQENKAERDFKLAACFLGCLVILSTALFIAVATSSYMAVSKIQQERVE